jgi:hypothetical protein
MKLKFKVSKAEELKKGDMLVTTSQVPAYVLTDMNKEGTGGNIVEINTSKIYKVLTNTHNVLSDTYLFEISSIDTTAPAKTEVIVLAAGQVVDIAYESADDEKKDEEKPVEKPKTKKVIKG